MRIGNKSIDIEHAFDVLTDGGVIGAEILIHETGIFPELFDIMVNRYKEKHSQDKQREMIACEISYEYLLNKAVEEGLNISKYPCGLSDPSEINFLVLQN